MSATSPASNHRVVCLSGRSFQCVGDIVVGDDGGGLAAWSLDTGASLWRAEGPYLRFTLVGDEVHALAGDEVPTLRVLDVRSGAPLRETTLADLAGFELSRVFTVRDGAYLLGAEGVLQRRSLADGEVLAEGAFAGHPTAWGALAAPVLGVASERGAVAAFATDTLARLWLRQGFDEPDLHAAGDVFVVSGQDDEEAGSYALLALDVRTGQTRWRNGVFGRALACAEEAVLACDHFGWVAALDARTGEVRWRQCVGSPAGEGVRVEGGFAVSTGDRIVSLSDDGDERARWPVDAELPFALAGASGGAIVCGAAAVGAAIEGSGVAPLRGDSTVERCGPGAVAALPGRARLTPAHARLEEARAVLREVRDLDEAWETLAVRGVIPASWVDDPRRRFLREARTPAWGPRPWARGEMLAFAADVEGVLRVEALWRECLRRFGLDAGKSDDTAWWACITAANAFSIGHFERARGERMWDSLVAALPSETLDAIEAALVRAPHDGDGPAPDFDLRMSDAAWRTAARAGLTVRVAGRALRVDASRNPYETLREIVATGYLVDADGVLRARPFDAELRALEEVVDEIPF